MAGIIACSCPHRISKVCVLSFGGTLRMCEFLVWIVDSEKNEDPYKDCKRGKAGNVITIQEDGWNWTKAELNNPSWRIGSLKGVPPDDPSMLKLMLSEEQQRKLDNPLDPLANEMVNPMLRA